MKLEKNGFTLVELMISMFIGLFAISAIYVFFLSARVSNQLNDRIANIQETGRFAIDLIGRDIQRAGYFGGNANVDEITGTTGITLPTTNCVSTSSTWGTMLEQHLFGINDTNVGYDCITSSDYLRGDIITLRYAEPVPTTSFSNNNLYIRSSLFEGRVFKGSDQANFNNTNLVIEPQTTHLLESRSYYIGESDESCQNQNIPALFWKHLNNTLPTTEQLLVGVEHLQFEYGIDLNGDNSPNQYVSANNVTDWGNIRTIKVAILVRDECPDNQFTDNKEYQIGDITYQPSDNFHRLELNSVFSLRNILNNAE